MQKLLCALTGAGIVWLCSTGAYAQAKQDLIRSMLSLQSSLSTGVNASKYIDLVADVKLQAKLLRVSGTRMSDDQERSVSYAISTMQYVADAWKQANSPTCSQQALIAGDVYLGDFCVDDIKAAYREVGKVLEIPSWKSASRSSILGPLLSGVSAKIDDAVAVLTKQ